MFGSFVFLQLMIPIGGGFPVGGPLASSTLNSLVFRKLPEGHTLRCSPLPKEHSEAEESLVYD